MLRAGRQLDFSPRTRRRCSFEKPAPAFKQQMARPCASNRSNLSLCVRIPGRQAARRCQRTTLPPSCHPSSSTCTYIAIHILQQNKNATPMPPVQVSINPAVGNGREILASGTPGVDGDIVLCTAVCLTRASRVLPHALGVTPQPARNFRWMP